MYPGGQIISGKGAIGGAGQVQNPFGQVFDKPSEGTFRSEFKGDGKGFLDNFKKGALSNLEKSKEKSDTDKYLDFMRESRGMMQRDAQFGGMGGGMATEVAQGLNVYQPPTTQQMFIPGQEGKPGIFGRLAGAALGSAMGPIGAGIGKAVGCMFG